VFDVINSDSSLRAHLATASGWTCSTVVNTSRSGKEDPFAMDDVHRRNWLRGTLGLGAAFALFGCGPSEVVAPPDERKKAAAETVTPPPKGMKPQEKFDRVRDCKRRTRRRGRSRSLFHIQCLRNPI
jgi:hypothetical protein